MGGACGLEAPSTAQDLQGAKIHDCCEIDFFPFYRAGALLFFIKSKTYTWPLVQSEATIGLQKFELALVNHEGQRIEVAFLNLFDVVDIFALL